MTLSKIRSNKIFFLVAILIAHSAMQLPPRAFAEENKYEGPLQDTDENAQQLIREMREVTEKYPVLSQRFGLVNIPGYRLPFLCTGGMDGNCHQTIQNECIKSFIAQGSKPDYNWCLELANSSCCRPAVHAPIE